MLCCKLESTVENVSSELKQAALEEVKQKKILGNSYILIGCANPYGQDNLVIERSGNKTKIYYCGNLVFLWDWGLKRYICGDWTNILSDEVKAIKSQRKQVIRKDNMQTLANKYALRNYVVC